jgi:hypothetical protein
MIHEAKRKETPSSTRGKKRDCLCTETIMLSVSGNLSLVAECLSGAETGFVGSAPLVVYPLTARRALTYITASEGVRHAPTGLLPSPRQKKPKGLTVVQFWRSQIPRHAAQIFFIAHG